MLLCSYKMNMYNMHINKIFYDFKLSKKDCEKRENANNNVNVSVVI